MAPAPVIGSLGELLVEFVCAETDLHHARPATYAGPYPSGAPGIFIDQAALQGAQAVFAGAVGADAFGALILRRLAASGVSDALLVTIDDLPTGTAHVGYNRDGGRDFVFNMRASAAARFPDGAAAVEALLAAGVEVLHVSGSTLGDPAMRARVLAVCRGVAARGAALSLDPNIRPELTADPGYLEDLRGLMATAAYVLPSDADAALLFPGQDFGQWSAALLAGGARAVALKRGAAGAAARDASGAAEAPGHAVAVVDPTGAGDCFCATFVTHLAAGRDLATALGRANAAGALAVTRLGPMEGNSSPAAIDAFLAGRP